MILTDNNDIVRLPKRCLVYTKSARYHFVSTSDGASKCSFFIKAASLSPLGNILTSLSGKARNNNRPITYTTPAPAIAQTVTIFSSDNWFIKNAVAPQSKDAKKTPPNTFKK